MKASTIAICSVVFILVAAVGVSMYKGNAVMPAPATTPPAASASTTVPKTYNVSGKIIGTDASGMNTCRCSNGKTCKCNNKCWCCNKSDTITSSNIVNRSSGWKQVGNSLVVA